MPKKVGSGRKCVWGLNQEQYKRALKEGGADQWLLERWLALKEDFKEKGLNQYHAWYEAAALIPPPDLTAEQALATLRAHDAENQTERAKEWVWEVRSNPPPDDASVRGDHFWLLRQPGMNPKGKVHVPLPEAQRKRKQGAAAPDHEIKRLLAAGMGKSCSEREEVQWAKEWLLFEWPEIDADTVPSTSAVSMLHYAKMDTTAFFRDMVRSLLPSRSEVDAEARRRDSGRSLSDQEEAVLSRLAAEAKREAAEDAA